MGKYIPVQMNHGVIGDVLIEIRDKTVPLILKRGQTIGLVTSCLVTQAEQGQTPQSRKEDVQSVTGRSNDMDTWIGGASVGDVEKAGRKADSVQSMENGQFYETEWEKCQFIRESFQLDTNQILNADEKLKEVVIKLF